MTAEGIGGTILRKAICAYEEYRADDQIVYYNGCLKTLIAIHLGSRGQLVDDGRSTAGECDDQGHG